MRSVWWMMIDSKNGCWCDCNRTKHVLSLSRQNFSVTTCNTLLSKMAKRPAGVFSTVLFFGFQSLTRLHCPSRPENKVVQCKRNKRTAIRTGDALSLSVCSLSKLKKKIKLRTFVVFGTIGCQSLWTVLFFFRARVALWSALKRLSSESKTRDANNPFRNEISSFSFESWWKEDFQIWKDKRGTP